MNGTTKEATPTKIAPLWGVKEVAAFLNVTVQTVYALRAKGIGPEAGRVGKHLRYDPDDVIAWFEQQKERAA